MHTTQLRTALLDILILSLPAVSAGQVKDCTERSCETTFDNLIRDVETLQTGTEILVRAEIDGYESADQAWVMLESAPSSIKVSGTVKDQAGKPIPNTLVSLPDLGNGAQQFPRARQLGTILRRISLG